MKQQYEIPEVGAMLLQGRINSLSIRTMAEIISEKPIPVDTLKYNIKITNRSLGTTAAEHGQGRLHDDATNRSIGIMLATGFMQYRDVQRPGANFVFSVAPEQDGPIQWKEPMRQQSPLVRVPLKKKVVPGVAKESGAVWLGSSVRSHLSAILLGMSHVRIEQEGISNHDRWYLSGVATEAGLRSTLQLAAHSFVNGAIELPETLLTAASREDVKPINYTLPTTLELPLGPRPSQPSLKSV